MWNTQLVLVFLFFVSTVYGGLFVDVPGIPKGIPCARLKFFQNSSLAMANEPVEFPIEGILALFNSSEAYGEIVLFPRDTRSLSVSLPELMYTLLPKAILIVPTIGQTVGREETLLDDFSVAANLTIPIGSIEYWAGLQLVSYMVNTSSFLQSTLILDENPWHTFAYHPAWIVLTQTITASCLVAFGIALFKLIMMWKIKGFELSLSQVTLVLQLICNPLIMWWWIGTASYSFPLVQNQIVAFTEQSIAHGIVTVCVFLVAFFWHELLINSSCRVFIFVSKLKVPALVAVILVMCFLYAGSIAFTVSPLRIFQFIVLTRVKYIADILFQSVCCLYFVAICIATLKKLKAKNNAHLQKLAKLYLILGFFQLVRIMGLAFYLDESLGRITGTYFTLRPATFRFAHWIQYAGMAATNILICVSFRIPPKRKQTLSTASGTNASSTRA